MDYRNIWPGVVAPLEDEIFTSWFMRVCEEHKIKSHTFSKIYFGNTQIWNRDIDLFPTKNLVQAIIRHTMLSDSQVKNLFLNSYESYLFNENINSALISKLGINHRKRTKSGMAFCPGCLDSPVIYYKKKWRLAISIVCLNCNLLLKDRCPSCESPICFHRLETGYKSDFLKYNLNICFHCKKDLRLGKLVEATLIQKNFQHYIDSTLKYGYNDLTGYSFQYFEVLLILYNLILSDSLLFARVKNGIEREYKINVTPKDIKDKYEIGTRQLFFPLAFELLSDWPNSFINFCIKNNVRYSEFSKDHNIPFWLAKVLLESNLSKLNSATR